MPDPSSLAMNVPRQPATTIAFFDPSPDHVPNPGMGVVYFAHSDHMHPGPDETDPPVELDRSTFERMASRPTCDNIYVRLEWREVQQKPGQLVIPPVLDWVLERAAQHGQRWSLRIMPSCPHSLHARSTPYFLEQKIGMRAYEVPKLPGPRVKYIPAYDDEYLKWWRELLHLLGERFDSDPNLEFADISGYGFWGEWHHYHFVHLLDLDREPKVMSELVDAHESAFPKTPAVMHLTPSGGSRKEAVTRRALAAGAWMRRDSLDPWYTPWELEMFQRARNPDAAYIFETLVPDFLNGDAPDLARGIIDSRQRAQRIVDVGFSYISIGFNPWHAETFHQEVPEVVDFVARSVGYRLRPSIVWQRHATDRAPEGITLGLINDGIASPAGTLTLTARFCGGECATVELPKGRPLPRATELVSFDLPEAARSGPISLSLALCTKGKTRPVRWAAAACSRLSDDRFELSVNPKP
jgi:hypothetical protein